MKLFLAMTGDREPDMALNYKMPSILLSYHYYKNKKELVIKMMDKGLEVFIDSGAFSAHNAGVEVNIKEYCVWLKEVKPTYYAVLDDMASAEKTLANQHYMEQSYGLKPIPVFHTNDKIEYLLLYLKEYEYICLGGMVQCTNLNDWLKKVWSIILKEPEKKKIHGFGMTDTELMSRYPWYSCDSSSFKSGKRFGRIPIYRHGKLTTKSIREFKREFLTICEDETLLENNSFVNEIIDTIGAFAYVNFAKNIKAPKEHLLTAQKTLFELK